MSFFTKPRGKEPAACIFPEGHCAQTAAQTSRFWLDMGDYRGYLLDVLSQLIIWIVARADGGYYLILNELMIQADPLSGVIGSGLYLQPI